MSSEIVAIIPARGGSKGIPRKNLRLLAGKPLIVHTIEHALAAKSVTRVVVSTDDDEIMAVSQTVGAEVVRRPEAISGDTASSESALIHVLTTLRETEEYQPDLVIFLQVTSPIRQPDDIDNAVAQLVSKQADSLFSAVRIEGFIWQRENDNLHAFNYDHRHRRRRQDTLVEYCEENGSIYIFRPWVLLELNNRLGGKIDMYEMDALDSLQIDHLPDLDRISNLYPLRNSLDRPNFSVIELLILDFDGVLTDNRVWVDQNGTEAVACHRGDSWGIARLLEIGVSVVVLSTETNPVVQMRCNKLGIACTQGSKDKLEGIQMLAAEHNVTKDQIAFVGNDINDLPALQWVRYPIAVVDGHSDVLLSACWITESRGGYGAVREICDALLFDKNGVVR